MNLENRLNIVLNNLCTTIVTLKLYIRHVSLFPDDFNRNTFNDIYSIFLCQLRYEITLLEPFIYNCEHPKLKSFINKLYKFIREE